MEWLQTTNFILSHFPWVRKLVVAQLGGSSSGCLLRVELSEGWRVLFQVHTMFVDRPQFFTGCWQATLVPLQTAESLWDMAAGFPQSQWSKRKSTGSKWSCRVFYTQVLEGIRHHFCRIPLDTHTNPGTRYTTLVQDTQPWYTQFNPVAEMKTRRQAPLRDVLEASYHSNFLSLLHSSVDVWFGTSHLLSLSPFLNLWNGKEQLHLPQGIKLAMPEAS